MAIRGLSESDQNTRVQGRGSLSRVQDQQFRSGADKQEHQCSFEFSFDGGWGIDDATHSLVGTGFDPFVAKKGNENLVNWLHQSVANAEFAFRRVVVDDLYIVIMVIYPAAFYPATFQNNVYIREGSHTKPILKLPEMQKRLWSLLDTRNHETVSVSKDMDPNAVLESIDLNAFLMKSSIPRPTDTNAAMDLLLKHKIIARQSDGKYSLRLFGALLFAQNLTDFDLLENKTVRIVQYSGTDRSSIQRQFECKKGYAVQFEELMNYISIMLPSEERIIDGIMTPVREYPSDAIREIIVNALMHQDLTDQKRHILVEIFDGRVEISNPGKLMVDRLRVVDWMPEPRNRLMATSMRSMRMCESLGSGWDRIITSCETMILPAPDLIAEESFTKVVLYSRVPFSEMGRDNRIWATYMHACRMHEGGGVVTNASLRERFGLG